MQAAAAGDTGAQPGFDRAQVAKRVQVIQGRMEKLERQMLQAASISEGLQADTQQSAHAVAMPYSKKMQVGGRGHCCRHCM